MDFCTRNGLSFGIDRDYLQSGKIYSVVKFAFTSLAMGLTCGNTGVKRCRGQDMPYMQLLSLYKTGRLCYNVSMEIC